ncbi:hypothetical protein HMI54_001352 [Coelomomyces lativittatus]|nr:hypothetical protein HMI55_005144 [Coelomomyces lativittatus]KAJ1505435.1 hypothetical protein HMI56_001129 [Coelomomyces lativittatus]KAJ1510767.1 hypothetical protein HMI54_001352 [Coelomomyces lativittatus]
MPSTTRNPIKLAELGLLGFQQDQEHAFIIDSPEVIDERKKLATSIRENYSQIESVLFNQIPLPIGSKRDTIQVRFPSYYYNNFNSLQISIPCTDLRTRGIPSPTFKLPSSHELRAGSIFFFLIPLLF